MKIPVGKNKYLKKDSCTVVFFILVIFLFTESCSLKKSQKYIDLSGEWSFSMDTSDVGISEQWFTNQFTESVQLPGSMRENGKGFEPTLDTKWTGSLYDSSWFFNPALEQYRNEKPLKFPFWLTPNLHYVGAAWYQKTIKIPANWIGQSVLLSLERPHWECTIWMGDQLVHHNNSLSAPHSVDLGEFIHPGENILTLRIDNRLDEVNVGPDSHSVSDHTQGNWNGVVGKMKIESRPKVRIKNIELYPDVDANVLRAKLIVNNPDRKKDKVQLKIFAETLPLSNEHKVDPVSKQFDLSQTVDTFEMVLPMGAEVLLWDEFTPNLYAFNAELQLPDGTKDFRSTNFGMRKISVRGKQILVNNRPTFFRGNVDCCVFPLTGYPPTDVENWIKIFQVQKDFGINHIRFHSWCPPEAAFDAADQLGIYLQPEGPSWANHGTSLGRGRPIDAYIYEETQRIIDAYGNHPSFCMMAYGNEPRGNYVNYLNDYLKYWKAKDPRRIYTGASIGGSWTECSENEFHVKGGARGLPWKRRPNSTFDYSKNIARFDAPFITHELGQYCVFPNFEETTKYTGTYKAYNFELFRDLLTANHMNDQAQSFHLASGELQKICYKYEIEATLRTPDMSGYQLLGLNDFPGQGTALVGVLDAFYEAKKYVTAEEFQSFCGPVTLLATLPKFVFSNAETFKAGIQLANYGSQVLADESIEWSIYKTDFFDSTSTVKSVVANGAINVEEFPVGTVSPLDTIQLDLSTIQKATKLTLSCNIGKVNNHWNFWVYPQQLPKLENRFTISNKLDESIVQKLENGESVLLLAAGKVENGKDVVQHFTPVFWNTSWFKMRPPHTTGLFIQNEHPVFNDFPTAFHSDLQWWELTNRQQVMNLENFPTDFRPLIQPIDTWFLNRRLAMLWEAQVGKGKLMVCSVDLSNNMDESPAARQLLYSIKHYMNSDKFQPEQVIKRELIQELFEQKNRTVIDLHTKNSPDELIPTQNKPKTNP